MQIESTIYADVPDERRLLGRVTINLRARAARAERAAHGLAQSITLKDISTGGFRLEGWRGLETGMGIVVELPPLHRLKAEVIWIVGHSAGCEFPRPLTHAELDRILAAHAPQAVPPERPVFGRKGV